jgi:hypothetical protein
VSGYNSLVPPGQDGEGWVDSLGPLEAERAWYYREGELRPIGQGLTLGHPWHLGPNRARCLAVLYGMHSMHSKTGPAPVMECSCGFWSAHDIADIWEAANDSDLVCGRVKLWGKVIPYEHGYRSQYAQPIAVYDREVPGLPTEEGRPEIKSLYKGGWDSIVVSLGLAQHKVTTTSFTIVGPGGIMQVTDD